MPWNSSPSLDVVAVDELLVGEDVAVGVEDALGEPGGARRVVELGRVVGGGVDRLEVVVVRRRAARRRGRSPRRPGRRHAVGVGRVGDDHLRPASPRPGARSRRRRRAPTARAGSRRASRCRGTSPPSRARPAAQHRNPVPALDPVRGEQVRGPVGERLQLAPAHARAGCRGSPRRPSPCVGAAACRRRRRRCCSGPGPASGAAQACS